MSEIDIGPDQAEPNSTQPLSPGLYVVATPIGNLEDLSARARRVLRDADLIAAEDTRTSGMLLSRLGIRRPMTALHDHNEAGATARIAERIRAGARVALISDAGTPAISDPGARLVAALHAEGLAVVPIPGASSMTALASVAGLPDGRFWFEGFLPHSGGVRRRRLQSLLDWKLPVLLFESPHRIETLAKDLLDCGADARALVVGRELTKRFEQVLRMRVHEFGAWLAQDANHRRGEFALLVFVDAGSAGAEAGNTADSVVLEAAGTAGAAGAARDDASGNAVDDGARAASTSGDALREEGLRVMRILAASMPPRQAAKLAARITGDSADALYRDVHVRR